MRNHTSTERTTEQELYRIVKALSDAMTLVLRTVTSDFSNTKSKSGEFALKTTTMINMAAEMRKLIPLHIERTIEPLFNILLPSYAANLYHAQKLVRRCFTHLGATSSFILPEKPLKTM
jgi:hypothetical protein